MKIGKCQYNISIHIAIISKCLNFKLLYLILLFYVHYCKIIAVLLLPWSGVVEDSGTQSHGLYSIDWWILNCLKSQKISAGYHKKYFLFKPEKNEKWSLLKWRQMILAASSNGRSRDRNLQSDSTHFSFTIFGCVDASQLLNIWLLFCKVKTKQFRII